MGERGKGENIDTCMHGYNILLLNPLFYLAFCFFKFVTSLCFLISTVFERADALVEVESRGGWDRSVY